MGTDSDIAYVSHTFKPWIGCAKVSSGCKHCYAEIEQPVRVHRAAGLELWGPQAARHRTSATNWRLPLRWNKDAFTARTIAFLEGKPYERPRVLCASLCDIFEDRRDLDPWRAELWEIIEACSELAWMLLTKRPECITRMVPPRWLDAWPSHAWIGTSIEDQRAADARIPHLLEVPAHVRWLSAEPLIGPINLDPPFCQHCQRTQGKLEPAGLFGYADDDTTPWCLRCDSEMVFGAWLDPCSDEDQRGVQLVVVGGEGRGGRPCDLSWIRSIRDQCDEAGVACFVKQLGAAPVHDCSRGPDSAPIQLRHRKGGDINEWPQDLRVQQMPK